MTTLSWGILGAALVVAGLLLWKIRLLQKAADEIGAAFSERLETETNTLIDLSSRDRHMRRLAEGINGQLRQLRAQRLRYQQGDMELKAAITNISHDLRTPLTAISGYLELLEKEELSGKAAGYTAILKNRAAVLSQLTEELFQYSVDAAEGELRMEPLSVRAVLEESLAAFYIQLTEKGITPELSLPEDPVLRRLDRTALRRVFANLLGNAVKYSAGDLRVELTEEGRLSFENTAPGLDTVLAARLFDRFYTVENAGKSTGLGLSIARLLTERMGGEISAEYREGRLNIRLCFPASEAE